MNYLSPTLLCDFYKLSHRSMYPTGTTVVYSTWTPRASRLPGVNKVVAFGVQAFIKNFLVDYFQENFFNQSKEKIVADYTRIIKGTLGVAKPETRHIEDLHDLGFLPLLIKAVPEGTRVPLRVPTMTVQNTDERFFWLTNYIETLASCELWQASTSATIANEYRLLFEKAAMETVGETSFVPFQGHDFSFRGLSSLSSAVSSGMGHLLSFAGTDTIPAIQGMEHFYGANVEKELVGTSIPATEHSVQCAYGNDLAYLENMMTRVHPTGFVSIVSDGYDFWNVIGNVIPALKSTILSRDGRVVIRPDSGDPVSIVAGDPNGKTELERKGAIEALWDIFGGTETVKGYKVLDSHIGLIYGDAITLERAAQILSRLRVKGFASTNVVFGIGSYTYQYNTRDTFGYALKSTLCVINEVEKQIFKDPKTDDGVKKSQRGKVMVFADSNGALRVEDGFKLTDVSPNDLLKSVYHNGIADNGQLFSEIKARLRT